jgi:hypothetical protein
MKILMTYITTTLGGGGIIVVSRMKGTETAGIV